jgi:Fe-S-cluster-containing dehydrogenase component
MKHGLFVLDLDRCTGCAACVVACNSENSVAAESSWRTVHTSNRQRLANAPVFHLSLACNHCLDPACLFSCPANAYTKDSTTGAVLVEEGLCMGCRYCSWVCPYGAPSFNAEAGVMEKCTFCEHRLSAGREPACTTACPTDALQFELGGDPAVVERPGFPEVGLRPAIRIAGRRRETPPDMTAAPISFNVAAPRPSLGWGGLTSEWSLWIFSSIAILLVAWFTASASLGTVPHLPAFADLGVIAMAVSAFHLGHRARIWRGVLNFRRSWVSREVVLFSAFFAVACLIALTTRFPDWIHWVVAGVGLASLFAMDMVYRVRGQPVLTVPHSAMAMLTGAFYIGILTSNPVLIWPTGTVKLVLYLARRERPSPGGMLLASVRIGVGILPALALAATGTLPVATAMVGAVIGELIDRAEFYANLRFLTPKHQIEADLARQNLLTSEGPGV